MFRNYFSLISEIQSADMEQIEKKLLAEVCTYCGATSILIYRLEPEETVGKLFMSYSPKLIHPLLQMMFTDRISHLFKKPFMVKDTIPSLELRQKILDSGDNSYVIQPVLRPGKPSFFFYMPSENEKNEWHEEAIVTFCNMLTLRFAEEETKKNLQNESILLSAISHEIRTQITAFISVTDSLTNSKLNKSQTKKITVIQEASENMLHTLNGILDYGKMKAGKLHLEYTSFNVADVITSTVELFVPMAEKNKTILTCNFTGLQSSIINSDLRRIRQIIFNLINNAIKYTHNGTIQVIAESDDKEKLIKISVKDTGIGIPASMKDKIFDAYEQISSKLAANITGTGLGLAICSFLVKVLGGKIGCENNPSEGTTFWFQIPYISVQESNEMVLPLDILIIDDEPINSKFISSTITRLGHSVTNAETAQETLRFVEKHSYDIIFMDLHLADADGLSLFSEIRKYPHHYETFIYALTGSSDPKEEAECLNAGFKGFLTKPLPKEILKDILFKKSTEKKQRFSDMSRGDSVVDLSTLMSFKHSISQENFQNLASEFLLHSYTLVKNLHEVVKNKNMDEVYRFSHNLKSAAKVFGLTSLSLCAQKIESLSKEKNKISSIFPLLKTLETEYNKSTMLLQQYLQENK